MTTRIMVVDDEPAIGKLLMYQLGSFGYQVSYIQDGLLALQRFALERPDLVLLDVMMPQINGWEVCRQIRACSSAPVIMLTAKSADTDVITGLCAGADDYIAKPFSMAQLQARIETVLRRAERARSPQERSRQPSRSDAHLLVPAQRSATRPAPAERAAPPSRGQQAAAALQPNSGIAPPRFGQQVRETRLSRGLSLHQVERACKIRWEFLQAIEQENFSYVPRDRLRPILKAYTEYLGLDLRELLGRSQIASKRTHLPPHFAVLMMATLVLIVVGLGLYWL
jgi:CheY-like chemotaxis protein